MTDMARRSADSGSLKAGLVADVAFHPGRLLAEELEVRNLTQKAFSANLKCSASAIGEVIRGRRRVTPDLALDLESSLGTPAYLWLRLQAAYDLDEARRRRALAG